MKPLIEMNIRIFVHHMEVDAVFDFVNKRTEAMPDYWINEVDVPFSVSGGYVEICIDYISYSYIRSMKEHQSLLDI